MYPIAKNTGVVPSTKKNMIPAPHKGFPDPIARSIMAWVTPQGIRTVKAPSIMGVKNDFACDWFLIIRRINFGGVMTKYLKIGWILRSLAAVASMNKPMKICIMP